MIALMRLILWSFAALLLWIAVKFRNEPLPPPPARSGPSEFAKSADTCPKKEKK